MASNEISKLIAEVSSWRGWRVKRERSGRWKLFPADREFSPIVVHFTENDWRAMANTRARIRRAGGPI